VGENNNRGHTGLVDDMGIGATPLRHCLLTTSNDLPAQQSSTGLLLHQVRCFDEWPYEIQ
jgi:hypothetical protein